MKVFSQSVGYFTDPRDGRKYKYVQIGEQTWMAENLKYETKTGCICYNNELVKCAIYGRLYEWGVAKKSCPTGWHLPSKDDFDKLFDYLGGASVAGGKLKESGNIHWDRPNREATNSSGFTALPGGNYSMGEFFSLGEYALFITTTFEQPIIDPEYTEIWTAKCDKYLGEAGYGVMRIYSGDKASIRCIKNSK